MSEAALWTMNTLWFNKTDNEFTNNTFFYKSWKDFIDCKPYKLWKPYILTSWCWKQNVQRDFLLQVSKPNFKSEGHTHSVATQLRTHPSGYDKELYVLPPGETVQMLQIVFISPDRFSGMHRVEMVVTEEDESAVREWIKNHMPTFWKL